MVLEELEETSFLNKKQKAEIINLWNEEYPIQLNYKKIEDFEIYLENLNNCLHYLIQDSHNIIKAWAFKFERENKKWFAIIIAKEFQGTGIGKKLLEKIKTNETELLGWVIDHSNDNKKNGEKYISPVDFYKKCDFTITTERLQSNLISAIQIKWKKQELQ
jgi:GNAT superfamily N-acetyltransferase